MPFPFTLNGNTYVRSDFGQGTYARKTEDFLSDILTHNERRMVAHKSPGVTFSFGSSTTNITLLARIASPGEYLLILGPFPEMWGVYQVTRVAAQANGWAYNLSRTLRYGVGTQSFTDGVVAMALPASAREGGNLSLPGMMAGQMIEDFTGHIGGSAQLRVIQPGTWAPGEAYSHEETQLVRGRYDNPFACDYFSPRNSGVITSSTGPLASKFNLTTGTGWVEINPDRGETEQWTGFSFAGAYRTNLVSARFALAEGMMRVGFQLGVTNTGNNAGQWGAYSDLTNAMPFGIYLTLRFGTQGQLYSSFTVGGASLDSALELQAGGSPGSSSGIQGTAIPQNPVTWNLSGIQPDDILTVWMTTSQVWLRTQDGVVRTKVLGTPPVHNSVRPFVACKGAMALDYFVANQRLADV